MTAVWGKRVGMQQRELEDPLKLDLSRANTASSQS
jgi:hypothetical protein